jgi:hypothetical protein
VDQTEWIDQIRIATAGTPFFQQESLHPNYWGQLALRNCVRQAYNGGSPRGGVCAIAGTGLNAQGEPRMTLATNGRRLSPPTPSAGAGNPNGGTPATALCPSASLLTGVTLHMNGSAGSVNGTCAPLVVSGSSVSVGAASGSTPRIGTSGTRDTTGDLLLGVRRHRVQRPLGPARRRGAADVLEAQRRRDPGIEVDDRPGRRNGRHRLP